MNSARVPKECNNKYKSPSLLFLGRLFDNTYASRHNAYILLFIIYNIACLGKNISFDKNNQILIKLQHVISTKWC